MGGVATPTSSLNPNPDTWSTNQIQIQTVSLQWTHQVEHRLHDVSVHHLSGLDQSLQHSELHSDAPDGHCGRHAPSTRGRFVLRHTRWDTCSSSRWLRFKIAPRTCRIKLCVSKRSLKTRSPSTAGSLETRVVLQVRPQVIWTGDISARAQTLSTSSGSMRKCIRRATRVLKNGKNEGKQCLLVRKH